MGCILSISPPSAAATSGGAPAAITNGLSQEQMDLCELIGAAVPPSVAETAPAEDVLVELEAYKRENVLPLFDSSTNKYADPLPWWKAHETRYPRLYALAMQFLQVQATSAPSERVFSSGGKTVTVDRASLLPHNVDMLVFLRANWGLAEKILNRKITGDTEEKGQKRKCGNAMRGEGGAEGQETKETK